MWLENGNLTDAENQRFVAVRKSYVLVWKCVVKLLYIFILICAREISSSPNVGVFLIGCGGFGLNIEVLY